MITRYTLKAVDNNTNNNIKLPMYNISDGLLNIFINNF